MDGRFLGGSGEADQTAPNLDSLVSRVGGEKDKHNNRNDTLRFLKMLSPWQPSPPFSGCWLKTLKKVTLGYRATP